MSLGVVRWFVTGSNFMCYFFCVFGMHRWWPNEWVDSNGFWICVKMICEIYPLFLLMKVQRRILNALHMVIRMIFAQASSCWFVYLLWVCLFLGANSNVKTNSFYYICSLFDFFLRRKSTAPNVVFNDLTKLANECEWSRLYQVDAD